MLNSACRNKFFSVSVRSHQGWKKCNGNPKNTRMITTSNSKSHTWYFYTKKILPKAKSKCILYNNCILIYISCTTLSRIYLIVIGLIVSNFIVKDGIKFLSIFSKIINPTIQSITLNKLKITFNLYNRLHLKLKFP